MEPSRLSHPASISTVRPASELLSVSVGVYRFIPVNGMEILKRLICLTVLILINKGIVYLFIRTFEPVTSRNHPRGPRSHQHKAKSYGRVVHVVLSYGCVLGEAEHYYHEQAPQHGYPPHGYGVFSKIKFCRLE